MVKQILPLREQQTRAHVIADQSVNHVERFIIDAGHTAQRMEKDYGYDLLLATYDQEGYVEPDFLAIQLKAAESLSAVGSDFVFDLNIKDFNLWMLETKPVVFILFDASRRRAYWLCVQSYFKEDSVGQPKSGAKTVRVRVPMRQTVNRRAIAKMRALKWEFRNRLTGEPS